MQWHSINDSENLYELELGAVTRNRDKESRGFEERKKGQKNGLCHEGSQGLFQMDHYGNSFETPALSFKSEDEYRQTLDYLVLPLEPFLSF